MKFTADKKKFTKEISKFLPFVERKSTIPILANLLLVAEQDGLAITGTNLDLTLRSKFDAHVKSKGSITVPARKLADTLKKLATMEADTVTVDVTDNWVRLTCGELSVKLVGMTDKNFPAMPAALPSDSVSIPAGVLANIISKTRFAVSHQESRYVLNGALLIVKPDAIAMVGTDGHRMAHVEKNASAYNVTEAQETIIPTAVLDTIKPFLESHSDAVVGFAKNAEGVMFFSIGNYLITSRPLIGKYPNWQAVWPKNSKIAITLDDKAFSAALTRVAAFANERSNAVAFELVPNKGVKLSASTSEGGDASETVKADVEDVLKIGLNAEYVLSTLKAMQGQGVTMKLRGADSAVVFQPVQQQSGYKFQTIVMPVRI